ncbi:hypothetical protein [uncultured Pseudokineococcus sp.]|uniref:hypothetical protein n=1 Tax=uncultured Pseudokineococcus sp. TaxID=1642928 RepID=UPI002638D831|nr:hypothetical protein [uncultured Pseudokineococcus sp.]
MGGRTDDVDGRARRGLRRRRAPEALDEAAQARVAASRARTDALCRAAVEELRGAGAPHDVTHAGLKPVALGTDVLTVHGSGWDLGRYVLWPDGTLREAGERIGWVDEATGDVRLRTDGTFRLAPGGGTAAACGGVWRTCAVVPHLDVGAVGERAGVVADEGVSRWADHGHAAAGRRRRKGAPCERSVAEWPDLAVDLPERVRRRVAAARGAGGGPPHQR